MSHDDLRAVLDALASAHGFRELAFAHATLQSAIRRKRAKKALQLGILAQAIEDALVIRDQMKADGVSPEQIATAFEAVVRDVWPKPLGRTEPWHFLCDNCQDYGGELLDCPTIPCERRFIHAPHSYLRSCYCKNRRFDPTPPTPTDGDAIQRAAKPQKPTKFFR